MQFGCRFLSDYSLDRKEYSSSSGAAYHRITVQAVNVSNFGSEGCESAYHRITVQGLHLRPACETVPTSAYHRIAVQGGIFAGSLSHSLTRLG